MIFALTPWVVAEEQGTKVAAAVVSVNSLASLIGFLSSSWLIQLHTKRVALITLALHTLCILLLFSKQYVLVWLLDGFLYSVAFTAMDVLLRQQVSPSQKGMDEGMRLLSWFWAVSTLTSALIIPVGQAIIQALSMTVWLLIGAASAGFCFLLITLFIPAQPAEAKPQPSASSSVGFFRLVVFSMPFLSIPVVQMGVNTFFLSYTSGTHAWVLSLMIGIMGLSFIFTNWLKMGYYPLMLSSTALLAIGLGLILTQQVLLLGIAGVLIGLGVGVSKIIYRKELDHFGGKHSVAVSYFVPSISGVIGSSPMERIIHHWGYASMWMTLIGTLAFATFLLLVQRWISIKNKVNDLGE